jgi:putative ABC transport system substrate-binding protein
MAVAAHSVLTRRTTLRSGIALAAMASPLAARAQGSASPRPEVGFLYPGSVAASKLRLAAFSEGLRKRGFIDGQNVAVIARMAEYDPKRVAADASELVQRKVNVILAVSPEVVQRTRGLTSTIPIVAIDLESDPVKSGMVASLAHPGGNVTGLFFDFPEFSSKWLELLSEIIPNLNKLGVLWDPATGLVQLDALTAVAVQRGVALTVSKVEAPSGMEAAFQATVEAEAQAILMLSSPVFGSIPKQVADLALRYRLPSITLFPEYAEAGGLIAYGTALLDLFGQSGEIVGKVLAGTNPADLPVERPSRFQLVINLHTAKALGVTVPPLLLARADNVIE